MQIESVAPAARREGRLRGNRHCAFAFALATALVGSSVCLSAPEAYAQDITAGNITASGTITAGKLDASVGSFTDLDVLDTVTANGLNVSSSSTFGMGPGNTVMLVGADSGDLLNVQARSFFQAPVTVNGNLRASGEVTAGTLTTTGKAILDSLEVTNGALVGGDLTVNGTTTLNGTLDMNGNDLTNVGGIVASGNIIGHDLVANNTLLVQNNSVLGGTLRVDDLATFRGGAKIDSGDLDLDGNNITNVGTITAETGNITTLNTTTIVNSDNTKTKTLTVDENATVGGQLAVAGSSVLSGGADISSHLAVAPSTTIDVGGNRVENVADPVALTDAANKGYVDAGLAKAFRDIDRNTEGVALAMAMAGTPTLLPMENFAITANWGQFEGAHGLAAGFALRLDSNIQLNGGVAYGPNESTVGTRAGIRIGW